MNKPPPVLSTPETPPPRYFETDLWPPGSGVLPPVDRSTSDTLTDFRPIRRPPLKRPADGFAMPNHLGKDEAISTRRMSEEEHAKVDARLSGRPTTKPRSWIFGISLTVLVATGLSLVVAALSLGNNTTTIGTENTAELSEPETASEDTREDEAEMRVAPINDHPKTSSEEAEPIPKSDPDPKVEQPVAEPKPAEEAVPAEPQPPETAGPTTVPPDTAVQPPPETQPQEPPPTEQ